MAEEIKVSDFGKVRGILDAAEGRKATLAERASRASELSGELNAAAGAAGGSVGASYAGILTALGKDFNAAATEVGHAGEALGESISGFRATVDGFKAIDEAGAAAVAGVGGG